MQLVNLTNRVISTSLSGTLGPGRVSSDGGHMRTELIRVLENIVNSCGKHLGIRLNKKECELLDKLMKLDAAGSEFKPESVPSEIRNDPTGARRAEETIRATQQKAIDNMKAVNSDKAKREAMINGEIAPAQRKPVGLSTMTGEKVDPANLKSGFEAIMEANARIANGEKPKEINPNEMLDPIGAHLANPSNPPTPKTDEPNNTIADAAPVKIAKNRQDDAVRTADAEIPGIRVDERAGAMDRSAADIAKKLSTIGPGDNSQDKPARGRGRSKKNS